MCNKKTFLNSTFCTVCVLEIVGKAACFNPKFVTLSIVSWNELIWWRWQDKSKSPHDFSGICLCKYGTLLASFGSVYHRTVLPDSLFTVGLRAQSWRAGEKRKRGKTWLRSHCRIYSETPPSAAGGHGGMQKDPPLPRGWTQWGRQTGQTRAPGIKPQVGYLFVVLLASPWSTAPLIAVHVPGSEPRALGRRLCWRRNPGNTL